MTCTELRCSTVVCLGWFLRDGLHVPQRCPWSSWWVMSGAQRALHERQLSALSSFYLCGCYNGSRQQCIDTKLIKLFLSHSIKVMS